MTNPTAIKEIIPKSGHLFQEITLHAVLCKPKIMPLKSVTLEKLEKMQKQAQDKALELERKKLESGEDAKRPTTTAGRSDRKIETVDEETREGSAKKTADVWKAEDEPHSDNVDDD